jgi:hypothetical protein
VAFEVLSQSLVHWSDSERAVMALTLTRSTTVAVRRPMVSTLSAMDHSSEGTQTLAAHPSSPSSCVASSIALEHETKLEAIESTQDPSIDEVGSSLSAPHARKRVNAGGGIV